MFEKKVFDTIEKYNMISKDDRIVVAVSGGPDSMALLNTLNNLKDQLRIELAVAHVNHMIRAVADDETAYVQNYCVQKNIPFFVKKVDVLKLAENEKISTEEAGRNVRYAFFEEVYKKVNANKIAIAHNANDNAETVLMNIIRGTGTIGLKGIEPIRNNKFIRPLIETERASIEEYCQEMQLNPKYDESNNENVYTRNKIRNMLIPFLKKEFNPSIVESINRLSALSKQENQFIDSLVQNEYKRLCKSEDATQIVLNLKEFNVLDDYIKGKMILCCITRLFGSTKGIEKKHVEDLIKLCSRNIGNKYLTPNKNTKIYVGHGEVIISKL